MKPLVVVVEGATDVPFARAVVEKSGLRVNQVYDMGGHGEIDKRLRQWCHPSQSRPMLVLRDYDPTNSAQCPAALIEKLAGEERSSTTVVRVAVRETEAWMLADREAASSFFEVPLERFPEAPDQEPDPKRTLVDLCRHSSSAAIRTGMVPSEGARVSVGRRFTGLVLEYGGSHWDPERAAESSPSVAKALRALAEL